MRVEIIPVPYGSVVPSTGPTLASLLVGSHNPQMLALKGQNLKHFERAAVLVLTEGDGYVETGCVIQSAGERFGKFRSWVSPVGSNEIYRALLNNKASD